LDLRICKCRPFPFNWDIRFLRENLILFEAKKKKRRFLREKGDVICGPSQSGTGSLTLVVG
jgi:hypothetical protein